jgi:hypothetical protein
MEKGANKSAGIPNFVSLAPWTCDLGRYSMPIKTMTPDILITLIRNRKL